MRAHIEREPNANTYRVLLNNKDNRAVLTGESYAVASAIEYAINSIDSWEPSEAYELVNRFFDDLAHYDS